MGLEPEGDSTAVWRHLPVDTKNKQKKPREMLVIGMRIKHNVTLNTQESLDGGERFYNQENSGDAAVSFTL